MFSLFVVFSLHPGQYLFKKGDEITDFYLVLSGIIQVSDASIEELEGSTVPWNALEGDEPGRYIPVQVTALRKKSNDSDPNISS